MVQTVRKEPLPKLPILVNHMHRDGWRIRWARASIAKPHGSMQPGASIMLSILGGVAEFERAIIRERQAQGIAAAKGRGAYRGRKKALSPEQAASLKDRAKSEKKAALAREFGISRETLYQYLVS